MAAATQDTQVPQGSKARTCARGLPERRPIITPRPRPISQVTSAAPLPISTMRRTVAATRFVP